MQRKEFFQLLPKRYSPADLLLVQHAYWLAKEGHRQQKRDTGERYFEHVRSVAVLCIEHGFDDPETVVLALLHDGKEDTFIPPSVYLSLFGREIAHAIGVLSKSIPMFDDVCGNVIGYLKKDTAKYFAEIALLPPKFRIVKGEDRLHNHRTSDTMKVDRLKRHLEESRKWILPLMDATEPRVSTLILNEIVRHETRLGLVPSV